MQRVNKFDFDSLPVTPSISGPLFDSPKPTMTGPFDRSNQKPTKIEIAVAALIWAHQGRNAPIAIAEIQNMLGIDARSIKETVNALRVFHRCQIGAKRGEPAGYYWCADAADLRLAAETYKKQILTMWSTLRVLDSTEACRELLGQLRLCD